MDAITSVPRSMFRRFFLAGLCHIGVDVRKANVFCTEVSTLTLADLGICHAISILLDDFVTKNVPDYKGCLPKETFKEIVAYNYSND